MCRIALRRAAYLGVRAASNVVFGGGWWRREVHQAPPTACPTPPPLNPPAVRRILSPAVVRAQGLDAAKIPGIPNGSSKPPVLRQASGRMAGRRTELSMRQLLIVLFFSAVACSSTSGQGGGGGFSAGQPCTPATQGDSCGFSLGTSAHLRCDANAKVWAVVQACAAGQACSVTSTAGTATFACQGQAGGDTTSTPLDTGSGSTSDAQSFDIQADTGFVDTGAAETSPADTGSQGEPEVSIPQPTTVQAVQSASTCDPSLITTTLTGVQLSNLVVTSPVRLSTSAKTGQTVEGLFAEQAGGGVNSGIYLFEAQGGPLATLQVGQVFGVTGDVNEYYCMTELKPLELTPTGDIVMPPIAKVDVDSLGDAMGDAANRKYESVLISLGNVVVSDALALGTDGKPHYIMVGKSANDKALRVGSAFGTYMQAKDATANYQLGQGLTLLGVMEFSFGQWQLTPITLTLTSAP